MARCIIVAVMCGLMALGPALADSFRVPGMKRNDVYLTQTGLKQHLRGRLVEFQDGRLAHYRRGGSFQWREHEDAEGRDGSYSFGPEGRVCVRYDQGGGRCDTYVRSVKDLVMIDGQGRRHEVKSAIRD